MRVKKEKFKCICPYCSNEFYATKSIFQEMGLNIGRGTCLYCNKTCFLDLDIENNRMNTFKEENLETYLDKRIKAMDQITKVAERDSETILEDSIKIMDNILDNKIEEEEGDILNEEK